MYSQFDLIGIYAQQSGDVIRKSIINELNSYREEYYEYINECDFDNYVNTLNDESFKGDTITLIATAKMYNWNIAVNDDMHILSDESRPIDIAFISKDDNYTLKEHLLNTPWSLYTPVKTNKTDNWMDKVKKIKDIHSVETFWKLFHSIPEAWDLVYPYDFYFFRDNIQPMWEDPLNKEGGKITISLKKDSNDLNNFWLYTLLGCIGEQFDESLMICGIVLNIRKHQNRINIWLNDSNKDKVESIALKWKDILNCSNIEMSFLKHDDNQINYRFNFL